MIYEVQVYATSYPDDIRLHTSNYQTSYMMSEKYKWKDTEMLKRLVGF